MSVPGIDVALRPVADDDVRAFFDHQQDPTAAAMAGFPARSLDDHVAHWARIRADPSVVTRTVVVDGEPAGNVVSWMGEPGREVGYWIGAAFWGRGVATTALRRFLAEVADRPLYGVVLDSNHGSIRVLERCGFFLLPDRSAGDDELVYVLTT